MWTMVRRLVLIAAVGLASMAFVTIATPAVSSADCANGEWWDPTGKVCRALGVGPQPLDCPAGPGGGPAAKGRPAAGRRPTAAGLPSGAVVGPDGQCLPATWCRPAAAGMRQR